MGGAPWWRPGLPTATVPLQPGGRYIAVVRGTCPRSFIHDMVDQHDSRCARILLGRWTKAAKTSAAIDVPQLFGQTHGVRGRPPLAFLAWTSLQPPRNES